MKLPHPHIPHASSDSDYEATRQSEGDKQIVADYLKTHAGRRKSTHTGISQKAPYHYDVRRVQS